MEEIEKQFMYEILAEVTAVQVGMALSRGGTVNDATEIVRNLIENIVKMEKTGLEDTE